MPEISLSRGGLSAIESGTRGMSDLMSIALARAYGLEDDALLLEYKPRLHPVQAEEQETKTKGARGNGAGRKRRKA